MSKIVAITTTFNGMKRYVTSTINRFDNAIGVELSERAHESKDFQTMDAARAVVTRIYNPFDRTYVAERLSVSSGNTAVFIPGKRVIHGHDHEDLFK